MRNISNGSTARRRSRSPDVSSHHADRWRCSMLHPVTGGADGAPRPSPAADATTPDQQLPLVATDDRTPEHAASPPDALEQARELLAAGETSAAGTAIRALIAREPRNAPARAALAELLEQRGDLDGAIAELSRAVDVAPDDIGILSARAAVYIKRGKFDLAEADLRRAVRVGNRDAEVQLQLGVLFCKRARWREAIEPLRAAVAGDPGRVAAHYYLGEAYNSIDELPNALGAYRAAVALDPAHQRALKAIGIVLDRMGRPDEAAAAYQRAREAQRR